MHLENASDAVKELFEEYGDAVYRYARFTLGNQAEAEDAVQDIFLNIFRGWSRFEHRSSAKTWLWKIASNHIKRTLRDRKYHNSAVYAVPEMAIEPNRSVDFIIDLERDLMVLTPSQRQVFYYRIIQDMSSAETASALGWTEVRVRVTLYRALGRLRNEIQTER